MTLRNRIAGWFVTPVDLQFTVAPADIVPGFQLDDTPASAELEHQARRKAALRHIHRTLLESLKDPGLRDTALIDFCLELRSTLQPSAPGSEVLREVPPVGIRYPAPVIPGRAA
jgi:hypothetical protein